MRFAALLRTSVITWLALPTLVLTLVAGASNSLPPEYRTQYAPAVAVDSFRFLVFVAAITAGCAAWEAGTLRKTGVWSLGAWRSQYRVAADVLAPVAAVGVLLMTVSVVQLHVLASVWPNGASMPSILVVLALPIPYTIFGFAVGCFIPSRLVSAPLVLVSVWFWIGFAGNSSIEVPGMVWTRHVTAYAMGTPDLSQVVSPAALVVPLLFTSALAGAGLLLWGVRRRLIGVLLATAVALGGGGVSWATARDWDYRTPMAASGMEEECTSQGSPVVCVPELYAQSLPEVDRVVRQAVGRLESAGVPTPRKVTHESMSVGGESDVWRVWFVSHTDEQELLHSVGLAAIPEENLLCLPYEEAVLLQTWLTLTAGVDPKSYGSDSLVRAARELTELPLEEQREWFGGTMAAAADCVR
ncbi:hypothetical protein SUDANB171_02259 [Streptomyces sp. enrichment culture]|uniref:DUF7224 domain-containing protein n=1 Tax=Streptomyces sp. enrichment culture TaxID=1795815 RepID=UPI003F57071C